MNIVKLNDILIPESFKLAEFFNSKLKGKYAYWIKMRYIFPLDSLSYDMYIKYEQLDEFSMLGPDILPHIDLYSEECCMMDFVNMYINICETEKINNVNKYLIYNEYTTDDDIDISKLRNFRSWLADQLLLLNTGTNNHNLDLYTFEENHMLEYYKNNMYNDIVKILSTFGKENENISVSKNNGCSCNSNIMSYTINSNVNCDGLKIYKNNLHNLMVTTFENVDFWCGLNKDFIRLFKKYIDNIIKIGLVINNSDSILHYNCDCITHDNSNSEKILRNLSVSLEYILNSDVVNHKNFIHDSLYNWAEYLYDYMYWKIN